VSGPDRDAEDLGDPVEGKVKVVMEDDYRPMVDRQAAEAALEFVAIDDGPEGVIRRPLVERQKPEIGCPDPVFPALGVAGAHEEPVRPGLEAGRVAQSREVLPGGEQRLLRRVLGEIEVAQDPARDREESIGDPGGKQAEGRLVAVLGADHEIEFHTLSAMAHRSFRGAYTVWVGRPGEVVNVREHRGWA
jgi:hypothetical protein